MELDVTIDGNQATIKMAGKLTVATAPELEDAIQSLGDEVTFIDLDITQLTYIASAGLRVIVSAEKVAKSCGGAVRLLNPAPEVMDVLEMTGLAEVLEVVR